MPPLPIRSEAGWEGSVCGGEQLEEPPLLGTSAARRPQMAVLCV